MKGNLDEIIRQPLAFPENEPNWLELKRKGAMESICKTGFPTVRNENWKYTSLEEMYKLQLNLPSPDKNSAALDEIESTTLVKEDIPKIVFVNGQLSDSLSEFKSLERNANIIPLKQSLLNKSEEAKELFKTDSNETFSLLNTALTNDGLLIKRPKNLHSDELLHVVNIVSGNSNKIICPRLVIKVAANSKLTVLEEYIDLSNDKSFTNALTLIEAETGSEVRHHRITNSASGYHIGNLKCQVGKDAKLYSSSLALGGDVTRVNIDVTLSEAGASCDLSGLFIGLSEELIDHHTTIDHAASHTHSNETFKGVMGGKSKGVFNGKVLVEKNIFDVTASQNSNNLLLSDIAEINTKPELEIYSDDISCAHGATVGQLDDDAIFYLRARGISKEDAKNMLVAAFIDDALSYLPIPSIRGQIKEIIKKSNAT